MKVILCTGCPNSDHEGVFAILLRAGLVPAQAGSLTALSPQKLQEQLLRSQDIDLNSTSPLTQVQPGKLWNQLATDLFLPNIHHTVWGWADHQTALLMDYWKEFEPQVCILLVYNSPSDYLAQVLRHDTQADAQKVSNALDDWTRWYTVLLRYFHRHSDYCMLVNSRSAADKPQTFINTLASQWQVSGLNSTAVSPACAPAYQHLQAHLIGQLIEPHHPAVALYQEIEGAALSAIWDAAAAVPRADSAWSDWVEARSSLQQITQKYRDIVDVNTDLTHERDQFKSQLDHLQFADVQLVQVNAEMSELRQENELLLLQLHQVQEELESYILKNQSLSPLAEQIEQVNNQLEITRSQCDALADDKAALAQAHLAMRTENVELVQQIYRLQEQLNEVSKSNETSSELAGLRKENELVLLQLHQVQEELESYILKNQSLTPLAEQIEQINKQLEISRRQCDALADDKAGLAQAHLALRAENAELVQQIHRLEEQLNEVNKSSQTKSELADLRKENELVQLQLHQVQGELAHYFLRYQELDKARHAKATGFVVDFWRMHQPQQLVVNMKRDIVGSNWYPTESDGRWAGPNLISTLQMPPIQPGNYMLELDIVDAMSLTIVDKLLVEALGQTTPVAVFYIRKRGKYPVICKVPLTIPQSTAQQPWEIGLRFIETVSPSDKGADDRRNLSIRLSTLRLTIQP